MQDSYDMNVVKVLAYIKTIRNQTKVYDIIKSPKTEKMDVGSTFRKKKD